MIETNENRKDTIVAWAITVGCMALVMVLLLAFGLKSQIPPPPPKKTFYVELDASVGGGGGGGVETPTQKQVKTTSSPNYATQNAQDAPSVAKAPKTNPNSQQTETPKPTINQNAMFKGGRGGTGSGGGSGSGIGTGSGSGLGPGTGSGSGGGIGYGTGTRGLINNINTTVNEEGQVSVEVHVSAEGRVLEARVINNSKFKTTITNSAIQLECVRKAKQAVYKPGKEELRVIVFR